MIHIGEGRRPEVDGLCPGDEPGGLGQKHLPAVSGGAQPGRSDDVDAGVPAVFRAMRLAGVKGHPHPDCCAVRPRLPRHVRLRSHGGRDGGRCGAECGEHGVALAVHNHPVAGIDRLA